MPENVKCADCGFLAVRFRQTRQLLDAESLLRERGYLLETDPITGGTAYEPHPVCFVRQFSFRASDGSTPTESTLKATVTEIRDCNGFTEWKQGFTPKEHFEMIQEAERIKWQSQREQQQRDFQAEQARLADERHRESQRDNWWRLVATAIGSLVVGVSVAGFSFWIGRTTTPNTAPSVSQTIPQETKAK